LGTQPSAQAIEALTAQAADAVGSAQQLAALDTAAAAWLGLDQPQRATELARQAVQLAEQQPLLRLRARAKARLAQALAHNDVPADAWTVVREAVEIATEAGDEGAQVLALGTLAALLASEGRVDEARLVLDKARETARSSERSDLEAETAFALGNLHATAHAWPEAQLAFAACRTQAEALGHMHLALQALRGEALALRGLGRGDEAQRMLAAALQQAQEAGLARQAAAATVDLAQLLLETGRQAEARTLLQGLDIRELPAAARGEALTLHGRILATARELEPAAEVLRAAVALLRQARQPRSLGAALLLLGQVEGMLGHGETCGTLLGEALLVTAKAGLPEQHLVRRVIERMTGDQAAP